MNEYDSNRIIDTVKEIGFFKTENLNDTDCFLLNTCHIRDKAKEKVYHEIGRVKKNFKSKKKTSCNSRWLRCTSRKRGNVKKRALYRYSNRASGLS